MVGKAIFASIIVLIALISAVGIYVFRSAPFLPVNTQTTSTQESFPATCVGICTSVEAIIGGQFQTATDKFGTGGTTVTVRGLEVLYVQTESDGDWHVGVSDGQVPVFITEIIPRDQGAEGQPPSGAIIDETGTPYCDTVHQTEAWHGNTCWEIHPVTTWHLSSSSGVLTTRNVALALNVSIAIAHNPITAGSNQTITFSVKDSDGPVNGKGVNLQVTYASGYTRYFSCTTILDGTCAVSWIIGSNSNPGTFLVDATVEGHTFSSSFSVT